ncbi:hypothetical protein GCM10010964_19550 [Caldovatus sediminis]|uniref:DUF4412 domain-containing protein n=1 Tax=Caldovatus sediminis TaxID=2041189 RepID=A0A8J3ECC3_9PROT|nr:hypothetical protein [Caldovatus sediminis]GGG31671.1 hypothetical protein GCM10010964_19550 [Caldovatus sediminis]
MRRRPLLAAFVPLLAAPACAQPAAERPTNLRPTRDVAIRYRVTGPDQGEMRIAHSAAAEAIRTDYAGFGPPGPVIADIANRRLILLLEHQRAARVHPLSEPELRTFRQPEPGTRFARLGTERIAGHACTLWRIIPPMPGAPPLTVCLTEAGAMLRAEEGGQRAEALEVIYAVQDPALFRIPDGWRVVRDCRGRRPPPPAAGTAAPAPRLCFVP